MDKVSIILKTIFEKIKVNVSLSKKIKSRVIHEGFGTPIKILDIHSENYSLTMNSGNVISCKEKETIYLTDLNKKVIVREVFEDEYYFNYEKIED